MAEAIIVRGGSPLREMAELKGRRAAVGRGSGCHFTLAAALKRAGLSFGDIKPEYLRPTDGAAAFERGSIDAWAIGTPTSRSPKRGCRREPLAMPATFPATTATKWSATFSRRSISTWSASSSTRLLKREHGSSGIQMRPRGSLPRCGATCR